MREDEVVREVRAAREAFAASHGYDVKSMVAALRALDDADARAVVRFAPRAVVESRMSAGSNPSMHQSVSDPTLSESS
jgi:hypothetical protein